MLLSQSNLAPDSTVFLVVAKAMPNVYNDMLLLLRCSKWCLVCGCAVAIVFWVFAKRPNSLTYTTPQKYVLFL